MIERKLKDGKMQKIIISELSEVAQSCLTLCDPMDTRLLRPWDFLGKSTGVGCHFLLQGIFLTEGSNPGLPHYRQTLYHLSHRGSLIIQDNTKGSKRYKLESQDKRENKNNVSKNTGQIFQN